MTEHTDISDISDICPICPAVKRRADTDISDRGLRPVRMSGPAMTKPISEGQPVWIKGIGLAIPTPPRGINLDSRVCAGAVRALRIRTRPSFTCFFGHRRT